MSSSRDDTFCKQQKKCIVCSSVLELFNAFDATSDDEFAVAHSLPRRKNQENRIGGWKGEVTWLQFSSTLRLKANPIGECVCVRSCVLQDDFFAVIFGGVEQKCKRNIAKLNLLAISLLSKLHF